MRIFAKSYNVVLVMPNGEADRRVTEGAPILVDSFSLRESPDSRGTRDSSSRALVRTSEPKIIALVLRDTFLLPLCTALHSDAVSSNEARQAYA